MALSRKSLLTPGVECFFEECLLGEDKKNGAIDGVKAGRCEDERCLPESDSTGEEKLIWECPSGYRPRTRMAFLYPLELRQSPILDARRAGPVPGDCLSVVISSSL